jgi:hypothetical protein
MIGQLLDVMRPLLAVAAGGAIGCTFGALQNSARLRHEKRQREGNLRSEWSIVPGSGRRVAYLLVTLAGIQVVCPLLFVDGVQWAASAGVVGGYGWMLWRRLQGQRAEVG